MGQREVMGEWAKPPHPAAATFARGRNGHGGGC